MFKSQWIYLLPSRIIKLHVQAYENANGQLWHCRYKMGTALLKMTKVIASYKGIPCVNVPGPSLWWDPMGTDPGLKQ